MPAIYFATVPEPDAPLFQPEFALVQKPAKIQDGVLMEPAETVWVTTDGMGIIRIPEGPLQDRAVKAMEMLVKTRYSSGPNRILGPFSDIAKAHEKQHEVRRKTDPEQIAALSRSNETITKENNELKAKLAALESATGRGKEKN